MFIEEFTAVISAANNKLSFLKKNPIGYFLLSILAGLYIGFGVILIFTVGGLLSSSPFAKIFMGLTFSVGLSLVVIAGAELFTGNTFVLSSAVFNKNAPLKDTLKLLGICYIGNWIGSILTAILFCYSGLNNDLIGSFIASSAFSKVNVEPMALFIRAILCNCLVCLAVWSTFKCKSESGKLIMIFLCLLAFVVSGFEHSIANMTLLTISLIHPFGLALNLAGYFYNIVIVTLGNIVGGVIFVALPYFIIFKNKTV